MLLSILMPALERRNWQTLHAELQRQAKACGNVEIIVELDDGQQPSGVKRNALMAKAQGDYVCFVDDDDKVAATYVADLVQGCQAGCDVVTFSLAMVKPTPAHGSKPGTEIWAFGLYPDHRDRGLMTVNHLCAWRKPLAACVSWCPELGYADDQLWYQPLYHSGLIKTQYKIDKVLYHYLVDLTQTANQTTDRVAFARKYVGNGLRCFFFGHEIMIEVGGIKQVGQTIKVRDSKANVQVFHVQDLNHFHTIKIN